LLICKMPPIDVNMPLGDDQLVRGGERHFANS